MCEFVIFIFIFLLKTCEKVTKELFIYGKKYIMAKQHIISSKPIVVCIIFFMVASTARGKFRSLFVFSSSSIYVCWKYPLPLYISYHCSMINIAKNKKYSFSQYKYINSVSCLINCRPWPAILPRLYFMKFVLRWNRVLHKCIFE